MNIRVSNEFKQECKKNISKGRYATIHIIEQNKDITESDNLRDFEINSNCYVNDKFIGTTVAKKVSCNIFNDGQYSLENKNVTIKTGMKIENTIEYQDLDTYIIPKPDKEEVIEKTKFTGYDYMLKFDTPYINRVSYPIRADNYLEDLCNQAGVELGSKNFLNSDYIIIGNPFTNGETKRTVLSNITQLALGFAVIEDKKLYIKSLNIKGEPVETIDGNNYTEFNPNDIFGPVNSFKIQMNSGVDGEESVREEENVTDETRCQISIADNYFLNSQEQREIVIDNMFNAIKGLTYLPVKIAYYGYPWLKIGDKIKVKDKDDNEYITYVMNHTFNFNGGYSGTIESYALTKTQSTYKTTQNMKSWKRRTELAVDKINGKISSTIEEIEEQNQKISQVTQTVDELRSSISDVADLTVSVEGNGSIILTNINESEPIRVVIRPVGTDIKYLYPNNNIYPSNDLYMPNRKVRFATDSYYKDLEIPEDLLYYDVDNYDEFILDYNAQTCIVNKKVGFDEKRK